MEHLLTPEVLIAFFTLTLLEIVLGIDNIIFISILAGKLPAHQQRSARRLGLFAALFTRIGLLLSISWLAGLTAPWITISLIDKSFSGRDVVLLLGGLFLIAKSTLEIHSSLEGEESGERNVKVTGFASTIFQIAIIDIVFSLDSVITAVGLVNQIPVMVAAIMISVFVMMWAVNPISDFVDRHPTIKVLALSFLILIGVALCVESFGGEIPKGYIYFAMAFSVVVEMINIRMRKKMVPPIKLRKSLTEDLVDDDWEK
jgi:predicted tellurium resistance membrane protein TerC